MFSWFRRSRHYRVPESYALVDDGKWRAIHQAIVDVLELSDAVVLVTHFPETFEQLQTRIADWKIDYDILRSRITPSQIAEKKLFDRPHVYMTLAEMLVSDERRSMQGDANISTRVSVIVCERHPLGRRDDQLGRFIEQLRVSTRTGYLLSLEEPLLRLAVGDSAVTVMKQLGLSQHESITSYLLTRRIDRFTRKLDGLVDIEKPASSQREWLKLNYNEIAVITRP